MTALPNSTDSTEPQIIKQDSTGRVQTPPARREALLDEFERSGMSAMQFAKLVGIKYPTFAAWAAKRRRQAQSGSSALEAPTPSQDGEPLRWVEACWGADGPPAPDDSGHLLVELPGGAKLCVRGCEQAAWAAVLLRHLSAPTERS